MNTLRKLELSSGAVTAVLGLLILLTFVREDRETAQRLELEFQLYSTVLIASLVYVLPSFLVFVGSYLHAVKRKPSGQLVLTIGSLAIVVIFLLSVVPLVWARASLWPLLSILLTIFAILTSVISFLVSSKRSHAIWEG